MENTLPPDQPTMLSSRQLSHRLSLSLYSLSNWRKSGQGPRFVKLGGGPSSHVRYPLQEVIAWENSLPRQDRTIIENVAAVHVGR